MAQESSVMKHQQHRLHKSALTFIKAKYVHYIIAPTTSWATSSSRARLLGFGEMRAELMKASATALKALRY
jgi:hypothetical protein